MNHSTADTTVARTELEASASATTRTQSGWSPSRLGHFG